MTALYVILGILLLFAIIGAGFYLYWFFYLKNKNNNNILKQEMKNNQNSDFENYEYEDDYYEDQNYEEQTLEEQDYGQNLNNDLKADNFNKENLLKIFYNSDQYKNLFKNINSFIDENYLLDEENYNYFFSILNIDSFDREKLNQKIDNIIFDFINEKIKIIDFMEYLTASIFVNKYIDLSLDDKSKYNSEEYESVTIENTFLDQPKSTTIKLHSDSKKEDFLKELEKQNLNNIDLLNELKDMLN